jgi:GNAT superfamily N-acetyltransferase
MAAHVSFVDNTRARRKSDVNALTRASIHRMFAAEEPEDKTSPLWDSWSREVEGLEWMPIEKKYVAAVATDRITGEPLGSLLLEPSWCNDYVELTCLGVVHERRGTGVGRALVTRTIDFVDRAIGAHVPIVLSVEKTGCEPPPLSDDKSDDKSDDNSDSGTDDVFYKRWELTMDDHDKLVEWYQGFGFRVENRLQRGNPETYMVRACDDQMLEDLVKFWNKDLDDDVKEEVERMQNMMYGEGVPYEYAQYIVEEQRRSTKENEYYHYGIWDEGCWRRRPFCMYDDERWSCMGSYMYIDDLDDYWFEYCYDRNEEPEGTWWWWFLQHNHPGSDVCVA